MVRGEVQGLVMHKSASIRQFLRNPKIFSTMGLTQENSNRFIQHNQFWPNLNFFSDVRWRCKTWRRLCYLIWLKQSTPGSVVPSIKCLCCVFTKIIKKLYFVPFDCTNLFFLFSLNIKRLNSEVWTSEVWIYEIWISRIWKSVVEYPTSEVWISRVWIFWIEYRKFEYLESEYLELNIGSLNIKTTMSGVWISRKY